MAVDTLDEDTTHRQHYEIQSLQLQIGATLIPQCRIRSHAECFYALTKSIGIHGNTLHDVVIQGSEYRHDKYSWHRLWYVWD